MIVKDGTAMHRVTRTGLRPPYSLSLRKIDFRGVIPLTVVSGLVT